MSAFNRFPSQAFIQWDTISEIIDAKSNFWKVAADGFFPAAEKEYEPENGENWILVPFVSVEGVGTRRPFAAGDADVSVPLVLVTGQSGGTGSASLFSVVAAGASGVGGGTVTDGGVGDIQLFFGAEGTGHTNEVGNCDVELPALVAAGKQPALCNVSLTALAVTGFGYSGQRGEASIEVYLTASGVGTSGILDIINTVRIPCLSAVGIGTCTGATGTCSVQLNAVKVAGSGKRESAIAVGADIILRNEKRRRFI